MAGLLNICSGKKVVVFCQNKKAKPNKILIEEKFVIK